MTRMFLAAGVAALAISAPAVSKPGEGKGNQGGGQQAQQQQRGGGGGGQKADRGNRGGGGEARQQQMQAPRGGGGEARQMMRAQRQERAPQVRMERQPQRMVQQQRVRDDNRGRQQARPQQMRVERAQRQEIRGRDRQIERAQREEIRGRDRQAERAFANNGRGFDRTDNVVRVNGNENVAKVRDFNRVQQRYADNRIVGLINGCPPGLDKKNNGCLPPGQAKKALVGTPLAASLQSAFLPEPLKNYWYDNDDYYYRYNNDGYLYQVDRDTNLIASLLPLFGGGYTLGQTFPFQSSAYSMPSYYQPFYQDTADTWYRYNDGYVYALDPYSGMIDNIIPTYDYGYGVGQMLPTSYSYYNLPYPYRSYYTDNDDYYYRYAPGAIYQVDRDTQLISAVASLLTGGFGVGQQLPMGYDAYNVPYNYRAQYYDTADNWYRYNNGYIYQVDPTSRLITAVIDAIV